MRPKKIHVIYKLKLKSIACAVMARIMLGYVVALQPRLWWRHFRFRLHELCLYILCYKNLSLDQYNLEILKHMSFHWATDPFFMNHRLCKVHKHVSTHGPLDFTSNCDDMPVITFLTHSSKSVYETKSFKTWYYMYQYWSILLKQIGGLFVSWVVDGN